MQPFSKPGSACGLFALAVLAIGPLATVQAETLARVGNTEVSVADVRPLLPRLDPSQREALSADPASLNQLVRSLLLEQLVLKEALGKDWQDRPEVLEEIERAKEKTIVESYLQAVSEVPETYPSDEDLRAYYESNKASFETPRQYKLAQIFVALPADASAEQEEMVAMKLEQISGLLGDEPDNFGTLAGKFSEEKTSAQAGGVIGWLTLDQIQPRLRETVLNLQPGGISSPVRLQDGYHILKNLEERAPQTVPLEDIREPLATRMRADRAISNRQAYLTRLLRENPVAINEIALTELLEQ